VRYNYLCMYSKFASVFAPLTLWFFGCLGAGAQCSMCCYVGVCRCYSNSPFFFASLTVIKFAFYHCKHSAECFPYAKLQWERLECRFSIKQPYFKHLCDHDRPTTTCLAVGSPIGPVLFGVSMCVCTVGPQYHEQTKLISWLDYNQVHLCHLVLQTAAPYFVKGF